MKQWMSRLAGVLLAVMMVCAALPGFGTAEEPATPTDLNGGTEAPTEEPVEEAPPVLVEDVVEPPMLMAAADELSALGLSTINGKYHFDKFDNIILESGDFYSSGSGIQMADDSITINSGATLTINGGTTNTFFSIEVYGNLKVGGGATISGGNCAVYIWNGGHLQDTGGSSYLGIYPKGGTVSIRSNVTKLVASEGNCTINMEAGANVKHFEGKNATIIINGGVFSDYAAVTNCTLTGSNPSFQQLVMNNSTGELTNGTIESLNVTSLPGSGTFTTNGTTITNMAVPESWLQTAIQNFAKNLVELYQGGDAPTGMQLPQSADYVTLAEGNLQLNSLNQGKNIYFVFNRKGEEKVPEDATTYRYNVTYHFGTLTSRVDVDIPVKKSTKIHLDGGRVTKVYDGTGDFSGAVTSPEWKTEDGATYTPALACTVSGTGCTDYKAGGYANVPCTVTISGNLPEGVLLDAASCKVNVMVNKRPLTLTAKNETMMQGDAMPSFFFTSNTGAGTNVGLVGDDLANPTYVVKDSADNTVDDITTAAPGSYKIVITAATAYAWSGKDMVDKTNNYTFTLKPGILTVEPATFTVTIPARVELTDGAGTMTMSCTMEGRTTLSVSVASQNDWKLVCGDQQIPYTLTPATRAAAEDALVTFSQPGTEEFVFASTDSASPAAGTYQDTLTFTVTNQ